MQQLSNYNIFCPMLILGEIGQQAKLLESGWRGYRRDRQIMILLALHFWPSKQNKMDLETVCFL